MADATSLLESGREATANDVTWATKEAHAMLGVDAVDDQPLWLRRNPLYWALVILIVVCLLICGTAGYLATAMQRRVRTLVFGKSRTS